MIKTPSPFQGMSLYSAIGERKYLNHAERQKFLAALPVITCPVERTFCEMIYWTGCRPSEALALNAVNIDLAEGMVILRSLKKRGEQKGRHFRAVPVPSDFIVKLDQVHGLTRVQARDYHGSSVPLWRFGRTKGWRLVRKVMQHAGLTGIKGSARGLRHALGVHAALMHVPETRLQSWLGHASLETTSIYIAASGPEDRKFAKRVWGM